MTLRVFLLMSCLLLLSACGMSPVYGTYANNAGGINVNAALDSVYIDIIPNRSGQKLRNLLMDRFYKDGAPGQSSAQYRLRIASVDESIYGLGIAKDATATRSQIRLTTTFSLVPLGAEAAARAESGNKAPLITRKVSAVSSFNTLASQYTTLVSEEDARDQTIRNLAQQIATLLELYFTNPAAFEAANPPSTNISADDSMDGEREDVFQINDPYRDIGDY